MSAAFKKPDLVNGIVEGVDMADYRDVNAVSASDLKNMKRSPAYARMRTSTSSPAKEWGTANHTAILEPDTLHARYAHDPEKPEIGGYPSGWRNTKAYKAAKADLLSLDGVEGVLTPQQFIDLESIRRKVERNAIGSKLHALGGLREASGFWYDEEFTLWRKVRPDWLVEGAGMIVDVKTARDHRPRGFARACHQYGYHLSAAYYLDTLTNATDTTYEHYVFLVVNSEAPFEVAAYTLDEDWIEQGRFEYRKHLAEWRDCTELQNWPGGSDDIAELRLPEFAINYHMEGS